MKLWFKALVLISVPLILQFVLGGFLLYQYAQTEQYDRREQRARAILSIVIDAARQVEVALIWVKAPGAPDKDRIHAAFSAFKRIAPLLDQFDALVREDPSQSPEAQKCTTLLKGALQKVREVVLGIRNHDWMALTRFRKTFELDMDPAVVAMRELIDSENAICDRLLSAKESARLWTRLALICGIFLQVLLASGLLLFFSRSAARRLENVLQNVARLARELPPLPAAGTSDEFGKLDRDLHDVSRQLFEQRLREKSIIDECPALIFSLGEGGRFTAANPETRRMFALPDDDEQPLITDLVVESDRALCEPLLGRPQEPIDFDCELRLQSPESTPTIAISALWCPAENQWFCVAKDITRDKLAAERRREIAVMVNHDLRTPLTAILAVYDLAQTPALEQMSAQSRALLQSARVNGTRALNLINSLLDLERIAAGKFELEFENCSLDSIISQAAASIDDVLLEKNLRLNIEPIHDIEVTADSTSLGRVITNLLLSAASRAEQGTQIQVSVARADARFRVTVAYTCAPGATNGSADFDFELALCEKLMRLHAGQMVKSVNGNDAFLEISLPGRAQMVPA